MTGAQRQYHRRLREMGCIITGLPNPEIHHCRAGSMQAVVGMTGGALKADDWLVIPLCKRLHNGDDGIHTIGVETWESAYDYQVELIDRLCLKTGIQVWSLAGIDRRVEVTFRQEQLRVRRTT